MTVEESRLWCVTLNFIGNARRYLKARNKADWREQTPGRHLHRDDLVLARHLTISFNYHRRRRRRQLTVAAKSKLSAIHNITTTNTS